MMNQELIDQDLVPDEALIQERVEQNFPSAEPSSVVVEKVTQFLRDAPHLCNPENTLYGQSVCSDEINFEHGDITDRFSDYFEEAFEMGGLAGIPFTGKTGFKAYSHHIAEGNNLFILFASHIGINAAGVLGSYNRRGNREADPTCGAACGALGICNNGEVIPNPGNPFGDYQMDYIINQVNKHKDAINAAGGIDAQQAFLSKTIYKVAEAAMKRMIRDASHFATASKPYQRTLYILGGVQINTPYPMEDYFYPVSFRKYGPDGRDLLDLAFGNGRQAAITTTAWYRQHIVLDLPEQQN